MSLAEFIIYDGPGSVGSHRTKYRFPNGYGASVIRGGMAAYGGLELAVLKYDGDDWGLCYDTPITDDVVGYLTDDTLRSTLEAVHALPPHSEVES